MQHVNKEPNYQDGEKRSQEIVVRNTPMPTTKQDFLATGRFAVAAADKEEGDTVLLVNCQQTTA